MDELAEWIAKSTDAFQINLVRPGADKPVHDESFSPKWTYPIFGEDEIVFGYTKLKMNLTFRSNDLWPKFDVKYQKKFPGLNQIQPMDIMELMKNQGKKIVATEGDESMEEDGEDDEAVEDDGPRIPFLPEFAFDPKSAPPDVAAADWRPPGQVVHKYKAQGKDFEIWQSTLADPRAKEIFGHMQILVPLFIEGGTLRDLDEPEWTLKRWKLFLLYDTTPANDKSACSYSLAGFSTSYRLWVFPSFEIAKATPSLKESITSKELAKNDDSKIGESSWRPPTPPWDEEGYNYTSTHDPLEAPSRERISQFLVLPPHQKQAHGAHLYNTMIDMYQRDPNVFEVTIEDPNEEMDDLRDFCDMPRLRCDPEFKEININANIPESEFKHDAFIPVDKMLPQAKLDDIRRRHKIQPRQFARLTELHALDQIPELSRSRSRITRKHKSPNENDRRYYFWRLLVAMRVYVRNADVLIQIDADQRKEKVQDSVSNLQEQYEELLNGIHKRAEYGSAPGPSNDDAKAGAAEPSRQRKRRMIVEDDGDEDDEEPKKAGKKPKTTT